MQGKRGLVMGVANDHSIAYQHRAQAHPEQGADLALTYQGEMLLNAASRRSPSKFYIRL